MNNEPLFQTPQREPLVIDEDNTVQKYLPRPVTITLDGFVQRRFGAGVQLVPVALADHPYLLANGMTDIPQNNPLPPMMQTAPIGSHAYAKTAGGNTGMYDASLIRDPRFTDQELQNATDMAAMANENLRAAQETLQKAVDIKAAADQAVLDISARIEKQAQEPRPIDERDVGGGLVKPSGDDQKELNDRLRNEERAKKEKRDRLVAAMKPKDKEAFDKMPPDEQESWLAAQK